MPPRAQKRPSPALDPASPYKTHDTPATIQTLAPATIVTTVTTTPFTTKNKKQKHKTDRLEDQKFVQLPPVFAPPNTTNTIPTNTTVTAPDTATDSATASSQQRVGKKLPKSLDLLPKSLPYPQIIHPHLHNKPIAGLADLNATENDLMEKSKNNPRFDQYRHDPSLEYYDKPLSVPLIKDAASYFSTIPLNNFAFDWTKKSPSSPLINQNSSVSAPTVTEHIYNYNVHFDQCNKCQQSTTSCVTKNLKDQNYQSQKVLDPSFLDDTKYPFKVIMDNKDMWRTHGKFAVRPCSDHNKHIELNINVPISTAPSSTYGQKTNSKNTFLYNHVRTCKCSKPHIGLFKEGTRIITPNSSYQSPSHHPLMNYALKLLTLAINKSGVQPFSDIDGTGYLRYIVLNVPNTQENQLYQQWFTHTSNGTKNDYKSNKKYLNQYKADVTQNTSLAYPQVQLSFVWAEGVSDELKKSDKVIDIEPLLHLPFPLAFDDLKRNIFSAPEKKGKKKPSDTTITSLKEDIPYAKERQEAYKQLYNLLKILLTDFKLVNRPFIDYCAALGYTITHDLHWTKEMAYYYQINQIKQTLWESEPIYLKLFKDNDELKQLLLNTDNQLLYDKYYHKLDTTTLANPSTTTNDVESNTSITSSNNNSSIVAPTLLQYKTPICAHCSSTSSKIEKEKYLSIIQNIVTQQHKTNPNWLKFPSVDPLNSTPGCIWGSIFVHYNNAWSHSNNVYSFSKNSWHHLFGHHCIDENVMSFAQGGIPLSAINYEKSFKLIPQQALPIAKNEKSGTKKNKTMKFDEKDDNNNVTTNGTATSTTASKIHTVAPYTTTNIAIPKFSFSPAVFRQGNLSAFSHLLQHLVTLLPSNTKHIVELHSGCGTISLHTLHHTSLLTVSDVNANNKATFQHALSTIPYTYPPGAPNNILYDKKVLPYVPLSSDLLMAENIAFADCIIVDPPRKGLDSTTLQYLSLPFIHGNSLYPTKTGTTSVGAKQDAPAIFPFDISPELYVNRTKTSNTICDAITAATSMTTTSLGDSNGDEKGSTIHVDTKELSKEASSVNKNKRDKKKWTLGYSKIADKHEQYGTMLFTNTKEHYTEQINKSKDGPDDKIPDDKPLELTSTHWSQTASTLIYVSCGFNAFKHDCDVLLNSPGKWKIAHTHAHLLFPGSNHIETLTVFVRGL